MRIYTVHVKETDRRAPDDLKAVAVREAFSIWAFLFRFLWAAFNGAWIVAAILLAVEIVLVVSVVSFGFDGGTGLLLGLLWAVAVGLFARDLKRWELGVLGYEMRDAVVAEDDGDALRRYFAEKGDAGAARPTESRTVPQFREDVVAPPLEDAPRMTTRPGGTPPDKSSPGSPSGPPPGPRLGPRPS